MTEKEWLTCKEQQKLLEFLAERVSQRKLRLFAVAGCWAIYRHRLDERSRDVLCLAARYADRQASRAALRNARSVAYPHGLLATVRPDAAQAASFAGISTSDAERNSLAMTLRDIFGNPFRPVTTDQSWLAWNDGTTVKLAQAIYDERELPSGHLDSGRLAILADALEDAGCTNQDILGHCRGPGPHVRGCWVVDLLLGKE